ncbi:MAG: hypothetical protein HY890_07035 [Deltaproteobacteria bacterium]|nr:hypothetical protein [Deltaproteobacteria bacterium]
MAIVDELFNITLGERRIKMQREMPEYIPHKKRDERIKSAVTAIKVIVPLDIIESLKKGLISKCFWQITEADGKYETRYRSKGALDLYDRGNSKELKKKLRHEHVFEKKRLIKKVIENPDKIEDIAGSAIGCTVTKEEHKRLSHSNPDFEGWERYKAADIKIYDLKERKEHQIPPLNENIIRGSKEKRKK